MRLLRGEDIELVSRELGVTAASLTEWREKFLGAGLEAMKKRPLDEREREVNRLREKVGEITMEGELLREKISRMEVGDPLARRRSRR
jgi:transposase-like protein